MSETTATALKFAAGIILAIVLVSIAVMVFQPAADSAKSVTTDFASNTTELKDQKFLVYDNTVVSGSQVINAIRKFKAQAEAKEIATAVKTGKGTQTWYYANYTKGSGVDTAGAQENLDQAMNVTHANYINPSGMFQAKIERDENGVIRAIYFDQKAGS